MEIKKNLIALGTTAILSLTGCNETQNTPTLTQPPRLSDIPAEYSELCKLATFESDRSTLPTFEEMDSDCIVAILPEFPNRIIFPTNTATMSICRFNEEGWICIGTTPENGVIIENGYLFDVPDQIFLVVYGNSESLNEAVDYLSEIYTEEALDNYVRPYLSPQEQQRGKVSTEFNIES